MLLSAYEVLSDSEKRNIYDRYGEEGESWIINGNEDGRKQRLVEHATFISTVRFASISGIVLIIWKSSRAMDHWVGTVMLPTILFAIYIC